jgi:hypothetical protein
MPAPTLDGRLLCASGCAYDITPGGVFAPVPNDVYSPGAGFLAPPEAFIGGDDEINACLVGTAADGVVVAFRGTLPFDLSSPPADLDWIDDFDQDPTPSVDFPGPVHEGFLGSLATLWDGVVAAVERLRVGSLAAQPVLITGHSKGGAMAALAAWKLQMGRKIPVKVVTFASAKAGDLAFVNAYNAQIDHTRYEYGDDIVPHLPPSNGVILDALEMLAASGAVVADLQRFDYVQAGVLRYITKSNQIVPDSGLLPLKRHVGLALEILEFRFDAIVQAHSIVCGSGYMTAVCPTGVCP